MPFWLDLADGRLVELEGHRYDLWAVSVRRFYIGGQGTDQCKRPSGETLLGDVRIARLYQ